jgi:hypothetical protein
MAEPSDYAREGSTTPRPDTLLAFDCSDHLHHSRLKGREREVVEPRPIAGFPGYDQRVPKGLPNTGWLGFSA